MRDTSNKPLVNGSNDSLADSAIKNMRNLIRLSSLVCLWITIWNAPTLAENPLGQWSAESPWPTVGVHLAVLADGRVLTWGEDIPTPGTIAFPTYVVTIPSGSTDTSAVQNLVINDDLFCAGNPSSAMDVYSWPGAEINPPRLTALAAPPPIFSIPPPAPGVPGPR